ncbi:MAG: peptidylprolyl isomerase [Candidatus Sabulitectum sp.]|nr:peptidylprolyl isomerase [Candidatus Sabulitectum sp.]
MNIVLCVTVLLSVPMTLERVVAVVGSEPVLHSDVVSLLIESGIDQDSAFQYDQHNPSYQLALEQLIEDKLLVEGARREDLYPGREEIEDAVDNALEELKSSFYSQQEFTDYLASVGMTEATLRDSYTSQMGDRIASENYVRVKAGSAMNTMPSDARAFFTQHPETVEEVLAPTNLSWIYLPVLPGDTGEAETLLADVRLAIESGETTFSAAATAYSQDGSASSGGDLDWFGRGDMTATFEGVAYSLEPGEIAGPFLTPFGVHLIKLTDRDDQRVRASHIIIIAQLTSSDLDKTILLAEDLVAEFEAGRSFSEAVVEYSRDPDPAHAGGSLGTVNIGAWEGEMRHAVIDLEPGEISVPVAVEQDMAVAIFRASEEQSIDWEDFSDEELTSMLQSVYWQNYYSGMVESLKADIPVVMNLSDEN